VPAAVLRIGGRIRAERVRKGISLRGLARSVGLSPSLISQIETGKCQPSVSTLYAITTALGVSVQDVFGDGGADGQAAAGQAAALALAHDAGSPVVTSGAPVGGPAAGVGTVATAAGALGVLAGQGGPGEPSARAARTGSGGPVVCPGQREILELDSGVTWQCLGRVPGSHVDFLMVTYAPGGCSSKEGRLMEHPGTEYGYLMQGELVVTLGFRSHRLTSGDAVSFASATPHSYRNDGDVPAVGIWFVAGPGGA
jgi:quercetin dioxygenase-like cupin family protein/DNA-binding XRE family transcriptional regulator